MERPVWSATWHKKIFQRWRSKLKACPSGGSVTNALGAVLTFSLFGTLSSCRDVREVTVSTLFSLRCLQAAVRCGDFYVQECISPRPSLLVAAQERRESNKPDPSVCLEPSVFLLHYFYRLALRCLITIKTTETHRHVRYAVRQLRRHWWPTRGVH